MANPQLQRRFTLRRCVLYDQSLSVVARLLYMLLDDVAGDQGSCYPKWDTILRWMGGSRRGLAYALAELKGAHLVVSSKRQHTSAVFTMGWTAENSVEKAASEVQENSQKCTPVHLSDVEFCTSEVSGPYCINQVDLTIDQPTVFACTCGNYIGEVADQGVRCGDCSHVHYPGCERCSPANPLREGTRLLAGYVAHCGLGWPDPDAEIVRRCLDAADGLLGLRAGLRWLLMERRAKPGQSYGWFPVALANLSRKTGTR